MFKQWLQTQTTIALMNKGKISVNDSLKIAIFGFAYYTGTLAYFISYILPLISILSLLFPSFLPLRFNLLVRFNLNLKQIFIACFLHAIKYIMIFQGCKNFSIIFGLISSFPCYTHTHIHTPSNVCSDLLLNTGCSNILF